jgi:hypothetical protein
MDITTVNSPKLSPEEQSERISRLHAQIEKMVETAQRTLGRQASTPPAFSPAVSTAPVGPTSTVATNQNYESGLRDGLLIAIDLLELELSPAQRNSLRDALKACVKQA